MASSTGICLMSPFAHFRGVGVLGLFSQFHSIFVSPAKQKRDICTAFPVSSLSSSSAA